MADNRSNKILPKASFAENQGSERLQLIDQIKREHAGPLRQGRRLCYQIRS